MSGAADRPGSASPARTASKSQAQPRLTPDEVQRQLEQQLGMDIEKATAAAWPVAIRLAGRVDLAEDLCQTAFMKLASKIVDNTLAIAPGAGKAYLRRAVLNAFNDDYAYRVAAIRGAGVPTRTIGVDIQEDQLPSPVGSDPAEVVQAGALSKQLFATISTLKPQHRRVMILLIQGGYSIRAMADLLDLPESTVRSQIAAARADILDRLSRIGWEVQQ